MGPDLVGWVAMPVSWLAIWLLARGDRRGWIVGCVADGLWIWACWLSGIPSFVVNDCIFLALRVWGWRKWRYAAQLAARRP